MQLEDTYHVSHWNPHIKLISSKDVPFSGKSVFIIRGGSQDDEMLFVRASQKAIRHLLTLGHHVYLLDIDVDTDYLKEDVLPKRNLAHIVKDAFLNLPSLYRIQMYTHAKQDINFTYPGGELSAVPIDQREKEPYNLHRMYIGDLKIGNPAGGLGWVDMFACMVRPDVIWPQLLANALGWPVRAVAPGYSVYFPSSIGYPRSRIPTNFVSLSKYDPNGWVVYVPGWNRFFKTSQPDDDEFLPIENLVAKRKLQRWIANFFEPFRQIRKKRGRAIAAKKKLKYGPQKKTGI